MHWVHSQTAFKLIACLQNTEGGNEALESARFMGLGSMVDRPYRHKATA